jgi:hypothetical protein
LFEQSSSGRMAMSMVVLGIKTRAHKLRKERATCLQKMGAGGTIYRPGRPAWADRPRVVWPPWLSSFSQHDHFPSVTFLPSCSTSCIAQTLSSTHFLALLVFPLDASCFESCPCSLAPLASHATMNFLQSYACCPPMLVLCMWS